MVDDEITLVNSCADLVSMKKKEAFPLRLLESKQAGEWVSVRDFCRQIGVATDDLKPELFAAWLRDPSANDAYAVILFYDEDAKWSMAAHYHRARLAAGGTPKQVLQPTGAATSVPSDSTAHQGSPRAPA